MRETFAKAHGRSADIYASMLAGAEVFLGYLYYIQVINSITKQSRYDEIDRVLRQLIAAQGDLQDSFDEIQVFQTLLRSAFAARKCHIATARKKKEPTTKPYLWGWDEVEVLGMEGVPKKEYRPCGELIGFFYDAAETKVILIPEAAYQLVIDLARRQRENFNITKPTLWRRLMERGISTKGETRQNGEPRPDVRRSVDGAKAYYIEINADFIIEPEKTTKPEGGGDD